MNEKLVAVDLVPIIRLPRTVRQQFTYLSALPVAVGDIVKASFRSSVVQALVERKPKQKPAGTRLKTVSEVTSHGPLTLVQHTLFVLLQTLYGATETLAAITIAGGLSNREPSSIPELVRPIRRYIPSKKVQSLYANVISRRGRTELCGQDFSPAHPLIQHLLAVTYREKKTSLCLFPDAYSAQYAATLLASWFPTLFLTSEAPALKTRQWHQVRSARPLVVCGTRSALFYPYHQLGRILIFHANDEGHRSWDQEPTYDVRVLAERLAERHRIPLTLTSALPPLVSKGKGKLHFDEGAFQAPVIIDDVRRRSLRATALTEDIIRTMATEVDGARTLLYTNRIGTGLLACAECHTVLSCQHCQQPFLQSDSKSADALCRRCQRHTNNLACAVCHATTFKPFGGGTAAVAALLRALVPELPLVQIDSTVSGKADTFVHQLTQIRQYPGIVVASPMILPRLWTLPRFTHTYVLKPELDLAVPTWRANEESLQTFATLWRHTSKTFHFVTSMPDHVILKTIRDHKFRALIKNEITFRRRFHYPPEGTLVVLTAKQPALTAAVSLSDKVNRLAGMHAVATSQRVIIKAFQEETLVDLWPLLNETWRVDVNPTFVP